MNPPSPEDAAEMFMRAFVERWVERWNRRTFFEIVDERGEDQT